jgi:hypothetical protein
MEMGLLIAWVGVRVALLTNGVLVLAAAVGLLIYGAYFQLGSRPKKAASRS